MFLHFLRFEGRKCCCVAFWVPDSGLNESLSNAQFGEHGTKYRHTLGQKAIPKDGPMYFSLMPKLDINDKCSKIFQCERVPPLPVCIKILIYKWDGLGFCFFKQVIFLFLKCNGCTLQYNKTAFSVFSGMLRKNSYKCFVVIIYCFLTQVVGLLLFKSTVLISYGLIICSRAGLGDSILFL